MDKPKEAIEQLRKWYVRDDDKEIVDVIIKYLDWLEGKHVCEWPAELTRERLIDLADAADLDHWLLRSNALRALAAIAPERKKRVAELWIHERGQKEWLYSDDKWTAKRANMPGWKCLARNIELEE